MDVPVVLSHRTAWQWYHAPLRQAAGVGADAPRIDEPGLKACRVVERLRSFLARAGVPGRDLDNIDVLSGLPGERPSTAGVTSHVYGGPIPADLVVELAPGLLAVSPAVSFVQSAAWLDTMDLVLYGYELCGWYERNLLGTSHGAGSGYRERSPLTSVEGIHAALTRLAGKKGVKRARPALLRVRDNARSPMEAATVLAILLPKSEGGLGYRGIELNVRFDVPAELGSQYSAKGIEVDVYAPRHAAAVEYDGSAHAGVARRTHDHDRLYVLSRMGVTVRTLTASHFANQLQFHRAMNGVASMLHVAPDSTREFQRAQNELRKRLIADWATD